MEVLEQRLAWIEPDHFERGRAVSIIERKKGGEGTATFTSPDNNQLLRFNLSEENRLRLLKQRKVADGVLLELGEDGQPVRLHLVELKGGVTTGKWCEIKQQLLGALHNAHALMGLLGLPMPEIVECHTCYTRDRISPQASAQPALFKPGVGVKLPHRQGQDWQQGYCELSPEFPRYRHHRHRRDERGDVEVAM
ncbi:hypothetical protein [Halomonas halodenitrificans]|uniref:hypothetical protein n=1 Tax=Halomonas halodenitrificans TaxID=28252 RepID=UPI000483AA13|nr:hypothetical protein [Halomonas halodenitrificans]